MGLVRINGFAMTHEHELDGIIASLAKPFCRFADTLLDLRQWAQSPARAGSCIKAYFDLVSETPQTAEVTDLLESLRNWLEARLNILVFDASRTICLEKLPLALADETDLARFCHRAMQRLRDDRGLTEPHLRLEFGFSRNSEVAA